ncbi:transposase [Bdellovibrio bacteriovorus]|uniref:transposase n=1 Tax=Bdellovibrio bacteriovorus TaxID=959 RepID=UPI003A8041DB
MASDLASFLQNKLAMPRKIVPASADHPYHIVARARNREWFPIARSEVWAIMEDYLFFISHAYGIEILSFVLMDNHFHMIARDPQQSLGEAMNYFMKETSRHISFRAGMINQIYGSRYHKTLINSPLYYLHAYKYVYRNPVEAGLCNQVQDYPHSTLALSLGMHRLGFPIYPDNTLFESTDSILSWLNSAPDPQDKEIVQKALRKSEFKIPTTRKNQRPHRLTSLPY